MGLLNIYFDVYLVRAMKRIEEIRSKRQDLHIKNRSVLTANRVIMSQKMQLL